MNRAPTESGPDRGKMHRPAERRTALIRLSDRLVCAERPLVGLLVAALLIIILVNLVGRSLNHAIYWADELAVYLMVWTAMVGASISVRERSGISIRLLRDYLPQAVLAPLRCLVDILILVFAAGLLYLSWIWYDPVLLLRNGFDLAAFKSTSFNFIYHEPAITLQIQKFWLWLIMPAVALTMSIHAMANLIESANMASEGSGD